MISTESAGIVVVVDGDLVGTRKYAVAFGINIVIVVKTINTANTHLLTLGIILLKYSFDEIS